MCGRIASDIYVYSYCMNHLKKKCNTLLVVRRHGLDLDFLLKQVYFLNCSSGDMYVYRRGGENAPVPIQVESNSCSRDLDVGSR